MRPYPVADDELYDDPAPRVVPVGVADRARAVDTTAARRVLEPWTPRDYPIPAAPPRRTEPKTDTMPAAARFSRTHKVMLAIFGMVCLSMVLGTVAWRIAADTRRAVDVPPPAAVQPAASPLAPAVAGSDEPQPMAATPGAGPITMEVRAIQPNYSVAPGDTLASIARRHGTTVDALASINNLENRNSLSVGQRLIIP